MSEIQYKTNDCGLDADVFIQLANEVWPSSYNVEYTQDALKKTINTTAWDGGRLVGCVRVLTDGYFHGTVSVTLVSPEYQHRGIGRRLMELAYETSPTFLLLGASPDSAGFYEKLGYEKMEHGFFKKKLRKQ